MEEDNLYKILDNQKTIFGYIADLKTIIGRHGYTNVSLSFVDCFLYGIIIGKRLERAKKHETKK